MKCANLFALSLSLLFYAGCGKDELDFSETDTDNDQREETRPAPEAGRVTVWSRSGDYDSAVFLPADYGLDVNKRYPLVLSLHGFNGSVLNTDHTQVGGERSGFIKQVWDTPLAQSFQGIVVAPDVFNGENNENSLWDIDKLRGLITEASARYQVDPQRITVTGYSAGSIAAQQMAVRSRDLIAGIMPGAFDALIKEDPCSVDNFPVWSFGNSSDPLFQVQIWRGVQEQVESCANYSREFILTVNENFCGHGCWDEHWARSDVQAWLVNQVRD